MTDEPISHDEHCRILEDLLEDHADGRLTGTATLRLGTEARRRCTDCRD